MRIRCLLVCANYSKSKVANFFRKGAWLLWGEACYNKRPIDYAEVETHMLDFLMAHWGYTLMFFGLFTAYLVVDHRYQQQRAYLLNPEGATQFVNRDKAVVVDIRSEEAYSAGHIPGSKHVPGELDLSSAPWSRWEKRGILLVCDSSKLALNVMPKFQQAGFSTVRALQDGYAGWVKENYPTVTKAS